MTTGPGRFSRWPLRIRLVAGFVAAMLVVLSAAGGFVYWRVKYALDRELTGGLIDSASRLATQVRPSGELRNESALLSGESYQVLSADGKVLAQNRSGSASALLDPETVRTALTQPVQRDVGDLLPGSSRPLRVYATAVNPQGRGSAVVLVVATDRKQRDEALRELLAQLILAGLATLLVTAVVGERLAKASLRPVERYRRQAADVAAGATGVRLDVPEGRLDEITRLGHTLNDMLRALEEALERERRFVSDASHELRTPLTLIATRVQLARRRRRTLEQHEDVLAEIEIDINRLARLADQLLDMGTDQRLSPAGASVDLAAIVRAEVERRHVLAPPGTPYSQAGSVRAVTSGRVKVRLDRAQLEQLVGNLLDNAAVHGLPPVTVTVDQTGAVARLFVTDTGTGMDAATLALAPERFARAPEARSRPGSGLGLYLVRAIVVEAGGQLRLCCAGSHERFGVPVPVGCDHGPEMTVTILLPVASTTDDAPIATSPLAAPIRGQLARPSTRD